MAFDDTRNEHGSGNGSKGNSKAKRAKAPSRKGHDGQEAVQDITALKKFMPKAIKFEKDDMDRAADKSEFYKKGGEETGFNVAQLKQAAKAYAKEEVEAAQRKAAQMTLILEECGQ